MARIEKSFIIAIISLILLTFWLSIGMLPSNKNNELTIKIYGNPFSATTTLALAAAYEKDLNFQFILAKVDQPFAQTPILEFGDVKLMKETRLTISGIASFNEGKGAQLLPENKDQIHTLLNHLMVLFNELDAAATSQLKQEINTTKIKGNNNKEAKLAETLDMYEAHLSRFKFMAGDSFSLIDLILMPILQFVLDTPTWKLFEERPHVHAWSKSILARPSWVKVLALQNTFDSYRPAFRNVSTKMCA